MEQAGDSRWGTLAAICSKGGGLQGSDDKREEEILSAARYTACNKPSTAPS